VFSGTISHTPGEVSQGTGDALTVVICRPSLHVADRMSHATTRRPRSLPKVVHGRRRRSAWASVGRQWMNVRATRRAANPRVWMRRYLIGVFQGPTEWLLRRRSGRRPGWASR